MKFVIALLIASVAATKLQAIDIGCGCGEIIPSCPVLAKGVNV